VSKKYSVVYEYSVLFVVFLSLEMMYCNMYNSEMSVAEDKYKGKGACQKIFHELSVLTALIRAIPKERERPSVRGDYILFLVRIGIKLGTYSLINANETEVEIKSKIFKSVFHR
jgi:hypothetical protein